MSPQHNDSCHALRRRRLEGAFASAAVAGAAAISLIAVSPTESTSSAPVAIPARVMAAEVPVHSKRVHQPGSHGHGHGEVEDALLGSVIVSGVTGRIGHHVTPKPGTNADGRLPSPGVAGLRNGQVPPSLLSPVGEGEEMTKAAAGQFRKMDAVARSAGLDLRVNSGYRTYAEQAVLYDLYIRGQGNLAAAPGASTHGLGLSADIDVRDPRTLAWLREHAAAFGFVNDVPSEAWHWTYKPH